MSPLDSSRIDLRDLIRQAAQVLEMHLIEDHARQQRAADSGSINSAQNLHWNILPLAHPEEFEQALQDHQKQDQSENI